MHTYAPAQPVTPWFRQLWPWLLMLMPAIALFGGLITLWLAITSNHALVVDDYYTQGKAINRTLARDEAAARLGLSARVDFGPDGRVTVELRSAPGVMLPDSVVMLAVHPTQVERDQHVVLSAVPAVSAARYEGGAAKPLDPAVRWTLTLEDPAGQWRLTAQRAAAARSVDLTAVATGRIPTPAEEAR